MCTPVDSECTLATVSFSEQVVLAWKDACNKAKGSCLRRRRGGGRLLSRAVMVFDALLRVLRTLIVVFLRIYHMYRKKVQPVYTYWMFFIMVVLFIGQWASTCQILQHSPVSCHWKEAMWVHCLLASLPFVYVPAVSLRRKVMVLDLDETLIHSHHDG